MKGCALIPINGLRGVVAHAIVDREDAPNLICHNWRLDKDGFAVAHVDVDGTHYSSMRMHRFITKAPKGFDVDHRNHVRLDNRRKNLRVCTHAQNMLNHLGYNGEQRGIRQRKNGSWSAAIQHDGRQMHLGCFPTMERAKRARRAAELKYRGEYAAPVSA